MNVKRVLEAPMQPRLKLFGAEWGRPAKVSVLT